MSSTITPAEKTRRDGDDIGDDVDKWETMEASAWSDSISKPGSTFYDLYQVTQDVIDDLLSRSSYDIVIEVGCGTGEVILALKTLLPRVGVDINPKFIEACEDAAAKTNQTTNCTFYLCDATEFVSWWKEQGFREMYHSPLLLMCNNTFNIMPASIRYRVLQQMREVAGNNGKMVITYWNGQYFSHGVASYYLKNPQLCGEVDINQHIDWKEQTLISSTGYHTQWLHPASVLRLFRSYDLELKATSGLDDANEENCLFVRGLGIFVVFNSKTSSGQREMYDESNLKYFYEDVFGTMDAKVGLNDISSHRSSHKDGNTANSTSSTNASPIASNLEYILKAQATLQAAVQDIIASRAERSGGRVIPARYAELGSGFGHLLRGLCRDGFLRNGFAVDFSFYMCEAARRLNKEAGMADKITVLNESFYDTSIKDESLDMVLSMDCFYLTGTRYKDLLKEIYRVLRPGGWAVITDINRRVIYDNDGTSEGMLRTATFERNIARLLQLFEVEVLASVDDSEEMVKAAGFGDFNYRSYSHNLVTYYRRMHREFVAWHEGNVDRFPANWLQMHEHRLSQIAHLAEQHLDWGVCSFRKL